MNYTETLDYLYHLGNEVLSANFKLGRIEGLLLELDHPQLSYPSIIIAGTNGKGSVTAMLDSILRRAGLLNGMYTSPHLVSVCERIKVAGKEITTEDFSRQATHVKEAGARLLARGEIQSMPTFFEHVTATAFSYFREQQVDIALLEVGLGGRLDATNTGRSCLAVITQIDFDHEKILGSTLEAISAEKAAVIKPGMAAVIGPQRPEVLNVLSRHCHQMGVTPRWALLDSIQIQQLEERGRFTFNVRTRQQVYENVRLPLCGSHQIENAVIAIEAAEALREHGFPITSEHIIDGVQTVVWPGRLEWLEHQPAILLDGAHNPAGAQALERYLAEFGWEPLTLIFGAMKDKHIGDMTARLFPLAQHVILTHVGDERSAGPSLLREHSVAHGSLHLAQDVREALQQAMTLTPSNGMICVAGSLHLVGAVKESIGSRRLSAISHQSGS